MLAHCASFAASGPGALPAAGIGSVGAATAGAGAAVVGTACVARTGTTGFSFSAGARQPQAQSLAPVPAPVVRNADGKLAQDSGRLGLENMLRKLHTTARMLQTTAHPDRGSGLAGGHAGS